MVFGQKRLAIPSNPECSVPRLRMLVREVGTIVGRELTFDDWQAL